MSRVFLKTLAGIEPNALNCWLDNHPAEPRITWYPSAGDNYYDLLYLSQQFQNHYPASESEPPPPDIYFHTGCVDPKAYESDCKILHESWGTTIHVIRRQTLPNIHLGRQTGIHCGAVVFLELLVESHSLGKWKAALICAAIDHGHTANLMLRHSNGRAKVSHCVLLTSKSHNRSEKNFPQKLIIRLLDKISVEVLITDRIQIDLLHSCHHPPSRVDLKHWTVVRNRGSIAWSGGDSAQFLTRPEQETKTVNEQLPAYQRCPLGVPSHQQIIPHITSQSTATSMQQFETHNTTNTIINMLIRIANPDQDLLVIRQLAHRFEVFGPYVPIFEKFILSQPVPHVNVANLNLYVAEDAVQSVVGFVAVEWDCPPHASTAKIHGIVVDQAYARQGIASQLLHQVIDQACERQVTHLECLTAATANPAALMFFTQHGFQNQGIAGNYPLGQQAVRLVLEIPATTLLQAQPLTAKPDGVEPREEAVCVALAEPQGPVAPWPSAIPYEAIKGYFQSVGRYRVLAGSQAWNLQQWPQGPGVYCIWRTPSNGPRQLLYIGKAGKFKRTGDATVQLNDGCLTSRLQRWTPYCFQTQGPYAEQFEYGPNGSVNEIPQMDHEARYREHIQSSEIQVECFVLSAWEQQLSPALLETLLIQDHLKTHGDLPVANNEF